MRFDIVLSWFLIDFYFFQLLFASFETNQYHLTKISENAAFRNQVIFGKCSHPYALQIPHGKPCKVRLKPRRCVLRDLTNSKPFSLNNRPRGKQEAISARGVEKIVPFQGFRRCQVKTFSGRIKKKGPFFVMATIKCYIRAQ